MNSYTRPQLNEAKQMMVRDAIAAFKKRNGTFKVYLLGKTVIQFKKLVDECNNHRMALELPRLSTDQDFVDAANAVDHFVNTGQIDHAIEILYTQNAMLTLECNQHRRAAGNRAMLEYAK